MRRYAGPPPTSSAKSSSVSRTSSALCSVPGAIVRPIPGKVRIDPPQPGNAFENLLEASLGLAVVDTRAVEYEHGSTGPVLHVVDHHLARSGLHPRQLTAHGASPTTRPRPGSRCRPRPGCRTVGGGLREFLRVRTRAVADGPSPDGAVRNRRSSSGTGSDTDR